VILDWTQIYSECTFVAQRGRGPGGQHVNRTSSAMMVHWPMMSSTALSESQRLLLKSKLKNNINSKGEIYLRSDTHRELERNKAECWQKLKLMIIKGLHQPKPRKKTKPSQSSKRRRLESKAHKSEIKSLRKKII
jgi:ribosome-associated protein